LASQSPANPALQVAPLSTWADARSLVSVLVCALMVFRRYAQGNLARRRFFLRPTDWEPAKPMSQSVRLFCFVTTLGSFAFTVFYFTKVIQVSVWDKTPSLPLWIWVYAFLTLTLSLLLWLVRDYLRFVHGLPSRSLSNAQIEPLRQAILDSEIPQAIKLYRQTIPDASIDEASEFVGKLAAEIKAKHPEKFQFPKPWDLNWRAMVLCLAVEAALYAILWVILPGAAPRERLFPAAFGFVLGAAFTFARRFSGFWIRRLGVMASITPAVLILSRFTSGGMVWEGIAFVFGMAVMAFGSSGKHRKST
jgi:hypothetical protein